MMPYILNIDLSRYDDIAKFGYHYIGIYPLNYKETLSLRHYTSEIYELSSDGSEHLLEQNDSISSDKNYGIALEEYYREAYEDQYNEVISSSDYIEKLLNESIADLEKYAPDNVAIERG